MESLKPMLSELDYLPDGLLEKDAEQLHAVLGGPTLIHLQGREKQPLFVSVLIHGNETVGWEALRQLLPRYDVAGGDKPLPRSISLFIGNTAAAEKTLRFLPGQPDFNRVWPGCSTAHDNRHLPEYNLMAKVLERMRDLDVFASIDLHNNTGMNPHYACINVVDNRFMQLATLFSRTVVYFTEPCMVASMAMSKLCPSVTLECGKVGSSHGPEHAAEFVDACLHLKEIADTAVPKHDIDLFHTVAAVKIPEDIRFGFDEEDVELFFPADIEHLNFRELEAGSYFGSVSGIERIPLQLTGEEGEIAPENYFSLRDQDIVVNKAVMPSMLTRNETVIRQDCLCYLMERYKI